MGVVYDQAVRLLLSRFKLPGEAQQIERIVFIFAQTYHSYNPGVFGHPDEAHILAYSIIQLHTDAHSEKIKKHDKMTKAQFVKINKEISASLESAFLEGIYHRVAGEKFTMGHDDLENLYNRISQGTYQGDADKETIG